MFSEDSSFVMAVTSRTLEVWRVLSANDIKKKLQRKKQRQQQEQKTNRDDHAEGDHDAAAEQQRSEGAVEVQRSAADEMQLLRTYYISKENNRGSNTDMKIRTAVFLPLTDVQRQVLSALGAGSGTKPEFALRLAYATNCNTIHVATACGSTDPSSPIFETTNNQQQQQAGVLLTDLETALQIELQGHQHEIRTVKLSTDGRQLLTLSNDSLKLWAARNAATQTRRTIQRIRDEAGDGDYDADGNLVYEDGDETTGGGLAGGNPEEGAALAPAVPKLVFLGSVALHQFVHPVTDAVTPVQVVASAGMILLPGGQLSIVGCADGRLALVSMAQRRLVKLFTAHHPTGGNSGGVVGLCAFGKPGEVTSFASIGADRRLVKFDIVCHDDSDGEEESSNKKRDREDDHDESAFQASKDPSERIDLVSVLEAELHEAPLFLTVSPADPRAALGVENLNASHPTSRVLEEDEMEPNRFLAVAMQDYNVLLFYTDTLKQHLTLYGHKLPVTSIAFSGDGTMVATVSMDKSLRIWGTDFGDCHKAIHAADDYITSVSFLGTKTHYCVTTSLDGSIKYWDADRWILIQVVRPVSHGLWGLAVSSDGTCVAAAGKDRVAFTMLRSSEILFPDEEEERMANAALEDQAAKRAAANKLEEAANPDGAVVGVAGQKTASAAAAGEQLMEALDIVSVQLQALGVAGIDPLDTAVPVNFQHTRPVFRLRSVWDVLWAAIMRVKPSETRHAVSSLTSVHVSSLLVYLSEMIKAKKIPCFETCARFLLAIAKPAPGSNRETTVLLHGLNVVNFIESDKASNGKNDSIKGRIDQIHGDVMAGMKLLNQLRQEVCQGLRSDAGRLGCNSAGLTFTQQIIEDEGTVKFFDKSKVQGSKRKFHSSNLAETVAKAEKEKQKR